ncbi:MAG: hypothetical protein H7X93_07770, partial [Sphingomonadaceae bacterium]|nr:hypothetical protein [Sphingomonadaceae bacterium]
AMLGETQAAVGRARGSGAESESWIQAQLALSALEGRRAPVVSAMGELDAILAGQAQSGQSAEVEKLEVGRARVEAILAAEAEAYAALAGALSPR